MEGKDEAATRIIGTFWVVGTQILLTDYKDATKGRCSSCIDDIYLQKPPRGGGTVEVRDDGTDCQSQEFSRLEPEVSSGVGHPRRFGNLHRRNLNGIHKHLRKEPESVKVDSCSTSDQKTRPLASFQLTEKEILWVS